MLRLELAGLPFNKAAHNLALRARLSGRSKASVEFKHQNISAALQDLGFPFIDGYKPATNYQGILLAEVRAQVEADTVLRAALDRLVAIEPPPPADFHLTEVDPPRSRESKSVYERPLPGEARPLSVRNYVELEARNRQLGLAGERLVLEFEHQRLWRAGARHLAERIEHVSQTKGDGLGFDIHSFETTGRDRLIEVKTTQFNAYTQFYATRNEVEVSVRLSELYQLYRVHHFGRTPRLFRLPGSLRQTCELDPWVFRARVACDRET
ncbi:MAG: DUF3883 domain-containing protein [Verrucomicrobia bacterium]|nr:DUF3883 domain-containing protein [Verrucomicrobiota bacterium]